MDIHAIMMGMFHPSDIDTLDNFKRRSRQEIAKLRRSGRPKVLTVNGVPAIVVQHARSYEELENALDSAECIAAVRKATAQAEAGLLTDAKTYFRSLHKRIRRKRD
jgi:PHD/YefM family antitoxin component YafN of YafNO toxin-antitoxin module